MSMPTFLVKNLHRTERLITSNSPAILTAVGVVGIVGTAVLTHKATTKANLKVSSEQFQRNLHQNGASEAPALTKGEKFKLVWKDYLPVVGVVSLSIAAVVGAQYINTKRSVALAGGYMVLEAKHEEYREKVEELLGKKKASEVDEKMAESLIHRNGDASIVVHQGDVLCIDTLTGKPFSSNLEALRRVENEINRDILHGDTPSVTDFYTKIGGGLVGTRLTDAFGWNEENLCELKPTSKLDDNGVPYLVVDFSVLPVGGKFWKVNK